ncbi:MAG TPA: lysylphosphatidylglycerol synthase transmembrane domain-containing protein [Gaiellaceae bacterium]|nr:lysylphosphatidylglycerol synthase transmembrane domain-containing protein [Gaiellaceae bacterium]
MSTIAGTVTPFQDRSRRRRLTKVAIWLGAIAAVVVVLDLLGIDVRGWLDNFWESLKDVSIQYIVAGLALQTVQTTLTALGWLFILRAGYPHAVIPYRAILAAYAAGIAMNGFLPANIGTFASLLMYTALIAGATFPGVLGAMVVQKIFFTAAGTFVYLYLFLSVPGSFELQLGWFEEHRLLAPILIGGGIVLLVILVRAFWSRLKGLWEKAKQGGAILAHPRAYFVRVFLPSFGAWLAKLGVIAVFLAAYSIPVTFHTVMSVAGGNSLANTVSATPGGVGINQAINTASLSDVTDPATAAAYSTAQQLIVTAFNVVFAVVLVVWAFGWSGGKILVTSSYEGAKEKVAEQKAERAAKKEAAREQEAAEGGNGLLSRVRRREGEEP